MNYFLTPLLLLLLALPLHAQEERMPEAPGQEEPQEEPAEGSSMGIFGFGGGIDGIMYFPNLTELNAQLADRAMPELSEDGMFMFGGHGYLYIMLIKNFRIGGMGAGGAIESNRVVGDQYQNTQLSTGFGGFTMEYIIPIDRFHIGIGALIGGGSNTLTLTRESTGLKTWDDIPENAGGRAVMVNGFFAWQPTLTLEYELSPLSVLSASGGYFGTSGNEWKLNDEFDVADVPDFKLSSFFIRLQLTFGLFL